MIKENKLIKIDSIKKFLDSKGIFYTEKPNGQFIIDGVNFWATKEKWHSPKDGISGVGINSLLKHLDSKL